MAAKTEKDIDSLIDQSLSADKSELDLREKEIEDEDLIAVVQSEKVKGVTAAFLEFNEIGDDGLKALLDSEHMKHLTVLNMFKNKVTDVGVKAMAASKTLINLSELILSDNEVGAEGEVSLYERGLGDGPIRRPQWLELEVRREA